MTGSADDEGDRKEDMEEMNRYDDAQPYRNGRGRTGYILLITLICTLLTLIGLVVYLIMFPDASGNGHAGAFLQASSKEGEPTEGEVTEAGIINTSKSSPASSSSSVSVMEEAVRQIQEVSAGFGKILEEKQRRDDMEEELSQICLMLDEIHSGYMETVIQEKYEEFERR